VRSLATGHQFVDVDHVAVDDVGLDVCRYDPVTQILDENHVRISADGVVLSPSPRQHRSVPLRSPQM
jgi:hypothetical protein